MARKLEKEYEEYCNDLLDQLRKGGLNKLEVHKAKMMYKHNKQAYSEFVELYNDSIELVFTPEGS